MRKALLALTASAVLALATFTPAGATGSLQYLVYSGMGSRHLDCPNGVVWRMAPKQDAASPVVYFKGSAHPMRLNHAGTAWVVRTLRPMTWLNTGWGFDPIADPNIGVYATYTGAPYSARLDLDLYRCRV